MKTGPRQLGDARKKAMTYLRAGCRVAEIADKLSVGDSTIRYWAKKDGVPVPSQQNGRFSPGADESGDSVHLEVGRVFPVVPENGDELARLRAENGQLREALLKKLAAELTLNQILALVDGAVPVPNEDEQA